MNPVPAPQNQPPLSQDEIEAFALLEEIKSNASWFFWIAALSIVNIAMIHGGSGRAFGLGFIVTQFADGLAAEGLIPLAVALGFDIILIGVFGFCGWFARKGASWAFILGLVIFGADSLLIVWLFTAGDTPIFAAFIHAWALFAFGKGLIASNKFAGLAKRNPFTQRAS